MAFMAVEPVEGSRSCLSKLTEFGSRVSASLCVSLAVD